jgi:MFS family permease
MPFFAIYFHDQVGLRGDIVGLGFLLNAAMGVVAVLAGAYFTDKFGRKKSLLVSILASAFLHLLYPFVDGPTSFLLLSLATGGALALYWPASTAMLTDLSSPEERARVFGWLRVAVNAGLGLGGLGGALTIYCVKKVSEDPALPYHVLFYVDAVTYGLFFFILWGFVRETLSTANASAYQGFRQGWSYALRDSKLLALAALNICFTYCYSLFLVGFSTFFTSSVGFDEFQLSVAFGVNTGMVVVLQARVWSLVDGWPRTRAMGLSAVFFVVGLLAFNLCAVESLNGFVVVLVAMVIFTTGEILHGPAVTSLFASLAPSHLRGTYMSVQSLCWSVGMGVGPVVSGSILEAKAPYVLWNAYPVVLVAAFFGLLALGRRLPGRVNLPSGES